MTISAAEQYLIELVNRARLDPLAEAQRQGIDLNQGLAAGTISTTQKQVLAPNALLEQAAQTHAEWLLATGSFSHTGENGSSVTQRITAAGYTLGGRWATGENLAFSASSRALDLQQAVIQHHNGLFQSAGHRRNLMEDSFREIGVAQVTGPFTWNGIRYNHASMLTEKFAVSGYAVHVTGVFYADRDGDRFYSIGEGTAGYVADGARLGFTAPAGGYALEVQSSAALRLTLGTAQTGGVVEIDTSRGNAKLDLVDGTHVLSSVNTRLISGFTEASLLGIANLTLHGGMSHDTLRGNAGNNMIAGGGGNDTLYGGAGHDTLVGGVGDDLIHGGTGNDMLLGGEGHDTLFGGAGNDTLIGNQGDDLMDGGEGSDLYMIEGNDILRDTGTGAHDFDRAQISDPHGVAIAVGGWFGIERISGFTGDDTIDATGALADLSMQGGDGNDILIGGSGHDTLFGGTGNDQLFGGDGDDMLLGGPGQDSLFGGAGNDTLIGNQGADLMDGGEGSDLYMIEGPDTIHDSGTGAHDFDRAQIGNPGGVAIAVGHWTGIERVDGFTGNDTIDASGSELRIFLNGGAGNDLLIGGAGHDTLVGGAGDDRLIGGAGNDYLVGGAGADIFVFTPGFGRDVIADFQHGSDRIELRFHGQMRDFDSLSVHQHSTHAVITARDTADTLILADVSASALTADDFIFF